MKPGDLVSARCNLDPTGRHFIPVGTLCLILGATPPAFPEESSDLRVTVMAANGVIADICRINLELLCQQ